MLKENYQINDKFFLELTLSNLKLLGVLKPKKTKKLVYISAGYNIVLDNAISLAAQYFSETLNNPIRYVSLFKKYLLFVKKIF